MPNKCWIIAADVQQIYYSDVKSIGTDAPDLMQAPLGATAAPASAGRTDGLQDRRPVQAPTRGPSRGLRHCNQPIPRGSLFNILAPGVIEDHATMACRSSSRRRAPSIRLIRGFSSVRRRGNVAPGQQTINEMTSGVRSRLL